MKKYRNYIIIIGILLTLCISVCFIPINATKFIPLLEKQVQNELGIKVHIEKLIFRFGPSIKLKSPIMHVMYEDGQKFSQLNNVKFFVPWSAVFKNDIKLRRLYADNCIIKVNSNDKYLKKLIDKVNEREFETNPNIFIKKYSLTYTDRNTERAYKFDGNDLDIAKISSFKNFKVSTIGEFFINDKKYIAYNLIITPNIEMPDISNSEFNLNSLIEQMIALDFHSDIITNVKIYKNRNNETLISGLLNIDNISVADINKNNPKSFIYLTFLGNRTGILSNVYASSDKKIYIDGVVNNSKNPDIDIKVKTDSISLSDIYKKIKLLVDCSKYKGIDALDGTLSADFSLKGDLKKIKSSGYLKIDNASIKANDINVNKICSDIDFSSNEINITNAIGYINNAPIILKGKINNKLNLELLMKNVELKNFLPQKYGVNSGIVSLSANIGGTLDAISHKENIQIDKFNASKDGNSVAFTNLKIDTNKENIAYVNNLIIKPKATEIIKMPLLKVFINEDSVKIPETNIFMPNSRMKLKAEIKNYMANDMNFDLNINGFLHSRDVKYLASQSVTYPLKFKLFGNKDSQNIESQLQLERATILDEPSIINFTGKIADNSLKIEDLSVYSFNGRFSDNLKSNIKGQKKVSVSGSIEDFENPIFKNMRIYIPQQLNITLADNVAQIKGDLFINGKLKQPEIVGQLSVQNLINQFMQLSLNNLSIDFNKTLAIINAPMIKLADSSFGFTSTVMTDFSKELNIKNLNIKSKYINTDTILMYKDTILEKLMPIRINDGKLYSEKLLMSLYGQSLNLSALSSDFKFINNVLYLNNISSEIFNGKLAGNMSFNMKDESFNSKIMVRGVSASPIFDVISLKKDRLDGIMAFDANITGDLLSKSSLNGNIKFEIHNGRMTTLGKLEHLLYAQNVVADKMLRTSLGVVMKAITLKDTGLFKYLRGDIDMKNGIANIKMLQSQGPLMSLFIKGIYNTSNDYAKLTVLGRLSDEVISGLGAFGEFSMNKLMIMLTGEEQKNNTYIEDLEKLPQLPMKNTKEFKSVINGTIDKPSSVILFNWISYSKKSYRQKEVPMGDTKLPDFVESLPY